MSSVSLDVLGLWIFGLITKGHSFLERSTSCCREKQWGHIPSTKGQRAKSWIVYAEKQGVKIIALGRAFSTSSLLIKIERPPWDWKAAMSRLVMRSTTLTARVTKVIWSCSSPRNLITWCGSGRIHNTSSHITFSLNAPKTRKYQSTNLKQGLHHTTRY